MINEFTTFSKSTQLIEPAEFKTEHLLELTPDQLSKLHGGYRGLGKRAVEEIIFHGIYDVLKYIGNRISFSSSSREPDINLSDLLIP